MLIRGPHSSWEEIIILFLMFILSGLMLFFMSNQGTPP